MKAKKLSISPGVKSFRFSTKMSSKKRLTRPSLTDLQNNCQTCQQTPVGEKGVNYIIHGVLQKCTCCVIVDNFKKRQNGHRKKRPRCTKGWRGVRSVRDKSIMDTNSCAASALLGRKWGGHRVQSRRTHVPLGRIAFLSFFSFQKWLRDDV